MPFLGVQPTDTFASVAKQTITGDGSVTYTLTHSVAGANDLAVFVNNVRQEPTVAYSASGTSITFTEAIASTDDCYVVYIARTFQTVTPPDNSINADQLSYPLTNFSSTGIDDNATSNAITIDSSNAVGINTVTASGPQSTFHIEQNGDDADGGFRLSRDNALASYTQYINTSSTWNLAYGNPSSDDSPTDILSVTASGNVGIGATNPAQELEVAGAILASPVLYSSNQDEAYLIAGTDGWTGATTNWNTFGFQHRIKTNSGGVVRVTIDNANGEAFCVNNASNVGIGTSEPQSRLDLWGTSSPPTYTGHIRLGGGAATAKGGIEFINTSYGSGYGWRVDAPDEGGGSTPIIFRNRSNSAAWTERMRVTATGELLVNRTSTPNMSNASNFGWRPDLGSLYLNSASATGPLLLNQTYSDSATRNEIRFFRNESQVGSVTANTTTTFYNTTSDYRVKENVVPLENALDRIKQIPVRRFNFIADPDTTVDGFIAHEVAEFVPEAIYGEKDGMETEEYEVTPEVVDEETGEVVEAAVMGTREVPEYQGIDQSKLVPLLTKAIQEQQIIIEDLQTRLSALEAN